MINQKAAVDFVAEAASKAMYIKNNIFPDLFFGSELNQSFLTIDLDEDADLIVVQLEDDNYLHFKSIRLTAQRDDGSLYFIDKIISADVYPRWREFSVNLTELVRIDSPDLNVHSDFGNSYVCIKFARTRIRRFELRNREDMHSARIWSVAVSVGLNGRIHRVYRHKERIAAFKNCVNSALDRSDIDPASKSVLLDFIFECIATPLASNDAIERIHLAFGSSISKSIRSPINDIILSKYSLSITAHGISKPFKYWPIHEIHKYINECAHVMKYLDDSGVRAFLSYGGLLGFVRNGQVISHDDDLDISVVVPKGMLELSRTKIETQLSEIEYTVIERHEMHFIVGRKNSKGIDIFFCIEDDSGIGFYPSAGGGCLNSDIFPLSHCEWYGSLIALPKNPFNVVRNLYGDDWRIPDPGFGHINWVPKVE